MVRGLQITSADNCAWEVWLWANALCQQAGHPDWEAFRGYWTFSAANGIRIAATGLYYYYIDGLGVYYEDDDAGLKANVDAGAGAYLNCTLVNRSAGAKTANAWFDLVWILEPTLGW